MTQLSEIYNQRILVLSANIPRTERLADADATATAHSKLCGSTITVDLKLSGDRVSAFGQTVKACLLGQAAASIMAHNIVGSDAGELRAVGAAMRRMLKANGPPPTGRWADLAVLEPVRDFKARHASTLLVFDAVETALAAAEGKRAEAEHAAAAPPRHGQGHEGGSRPRRQGRRQGPGARLQVDPEAPHRHGMQAPAHVLGVCPAGHRHQRRVARDLARAVARLPLPSLGHARFRSGARHRPSEASLRAVALRPLEA